MVQNERACIAGAIIGAAVGAAIGYLYGTDEGARHRAEFARFIDRAVGDAEEGSRVWARLKDVWLQYEHERASTASRAGISKAWPPEGAA